MKYTELFSMNGQVALVTGGNGGIGRAIALSYAEAGASVAIVGRNKEKNAKVLAELQAIGVPSMALSVDVTARDTLEPAVKQIEAELGPVDVLVNNAGVAIPSGGILAEDPDNWDLTIETVLNSVFLISKYVAKSMAERKRGKIINLGSMTSYFGSNIVPSYSSAKGAIVQLTKSMAIELAAYNIQVNAIAPGFIETDMTADFSHGEFGEAVEARTPAGRWGQPEEIAGTAVFLASKASDFVTGEMIRVDGGYAIC
jgi:2-deoxy-D-gluconate 3-dehydrogenase